jgi:hypothetical protein
MRKNFRNDNDCRILNYNKIMAQHCDRAFRYLQEVLGRTNLPTFPMAMVTIVTLAKDYVM